MNPDVYVFLRIAKHVFVRIYKSGKNPYEIREIGSFSLTLYRKRRGEMEKVKKDQKKEIVVLDEGINRNASDDSVRGWGMCCWANFMPFCIL
jgi:hypothetical protein